MNLMTLPAGDFSRQQLKEDLGQQIEVDEAVLSRMLPRGIMCGMGINGNVADGKKKKKDCRRARRSSAPPATAQTAGRAPQS
jgi:hypothetical protein